MKKPYGRYPTGIANHEALAGARNLLDSSHTLRLELAPLEGPLLLLALAPRALCLEPTSCPSCGVCSTQTMSPCYHISLGVHRSYACLFYVNGLFLALSLAFSILPPCPHVQFKLWLSLSSCSLEV